MFLGRKEELNDLEERYNSDRFEFGLLSGPRRIGKTSLLDAFISGKKSLFLQAFDQSDEMNLRDMSFSLHQAMGTSLAYVYPSWDLLFNDVASFFGKEKGVMVIDEYPNMVLTQEGKPKNNGFASKLQYAIDHIFSKTKITLIITGSNVSFMKQLVNDSHDPLYERKTFELSLGKLSFKEANLFLEGREKKDKADCLSLFGSHPYYLSLLNPHKTAYENLSSFFYQRDSAFLDAPGEVLSASHRSPFYNSLLFSLSSGKHTVKEMSDDLKEDNAKVAKYLGDLEEDEIVEKRFMFNSERKTSYEIKDSLLRFWYRFIAKNKDKIRLGYGKVLLDLQKDQINDFMAHSFEDVANLYLEQLGIEGKLNGIFLPIQHLQIDKTELGRPVEFDGIASDGKKLLIAETKRTKNSRGLKDLKHLEESASLKMFSSFNKPDYFLISYNGFAEDLKSYKDGHVHLISLEEMFK